MLERRNFLKTGMLVSAGLWSSESFLSLGSAFGQTLAWDFTLTFGSCNRQNLDQNHWSQLSRLPADVFIWLGDTIYADNATVENRRNTFMNLRQNPYYKNFLSNRRIIGVYDDHDYAYNNALGDYEFRFQSQLSFLDFLGEPETSPLRNKQGLFQTHTFDSNGISVGVILLDTRFFRTETTILGEEQWRLFETELKNLDTNCSVLVIGSSINVNSSIVGGGVESWKQVPKDLARMKRVLSDLVHPVVILSGDRHQGDLVEVTLDSGKRIFEFMSSGLTHAASFNFPKTFGHKISPVTKNNAGVIKFKKEGNEKLRIQFELISPQNLSVLGSYEALLDV